MCSKSECLSGHLRGKPRNGVALEGPGACHSVSDSGPQTSRLVSFPFSLLFIYLSNTFRNMHRSCVPSAAEPVRQNLASDDDVPAMRLLPSGCTRDFLSMREHGWDSHLWRAVRVHRETRFLAQLEGEPSQAPAPEDWHRLLVLSGPFSGHVDFLLGKHIL